ncbi:hypothetical protein SELMODRAFT_45338, partial [Selaginella moellendorffii]
VPALFVFGDSFVDSGNNNFFNTSAKCNHPPYGINFEGRRSTGRWSDGLIVTDYIASFLGLPYPPNFHDKRANFSTGANFASASAGIFNTTGLQGIRTFEQQIGDFEQLSTTLEQHHGHRTISRAIFYLNIGTNDVANAVRATGSQAPLELLAALLRSLECDLHRLYSCGARKMVVVSAAIIGCPPLEKRSLPCEPAGESSARAYNRALQQLLRDFSSSHLGLHIVYANLHDLMMGVIQQPGAFGLSSTVDPCCPVGGGRWCNATDSYCSNPSQYLFWDIAHPSSAFNRIAAHRFWNG